ncbi:hypothetical protein ACFRFL_45945 [Streptomyces sp. NPDC056708]|uniref:hypothetical protein n=1 Tax=unclassified Streptomyces TaxID=2593676 RepID=UPI0036C2EDDD
MTRSLTAPQGLGDDGGRGLEDELADGEEMASMRNGSGDEYSIVFSAAGAYVRGFDHETPTRMATTANLGRE